MMLSSDKISKVFGRVLSSVYENGTLEVWATSTTRDPATGTFPEVLQSSTPCKLQRDKCTEQQRASQNYSPTDVRFLVLQDNLGGEPNTDSRVRYRGKVYAVMSVDQDPARAYFDLRARRT